MSTTQNEDKNEIVSPSPGVGVGVRVDSSDPGPETPLFTSPPALFIEKYGQIIDIEHVFKEHDQQKHQMEQKIKEGNLHILIYCLDKVKNKF